MILHYVRTVLVGVKEIFPNDAEKWQQYTELKSIVLGEMKEKITKQKQFLLQD